LFEYFYSFVGFYYWMKNENGPRPRPKQILARKPRSRHVATLFQYYEQTNPDAHGRMSPPFQQHFQVLAMPRRTVDGLAD
jgi:hypothetical protein